MNKPIHSETTRSLGLDNDFNLNTYPINSMKYKTKFALTIYDMPKIRRQKLPVVPPIPPWENLKQLVTTFYDYKNELNTDQKFNNYLQNKFENYNHIYTDGSKTERGESVSCAMYIKEQNIVQGWKLNFFFFKYWG